MSGGQQNKDVEVVKMVDRMNQLKEKQDSVSLSQSGALRLQRVRFVFCGPNVEAQRLLLLAWPRFVLQSLSQTAKKPPGTSILIPGFSRIV